MLTNGYDGEVCWSSAATLETRYRLIFETVTGNGGCRMGLWRSAVRWAVIKYSRELGGMSYCKTSGDDSDVFGLWLPCRHVTVFLG
ncbi:Hypothetical protein CINCED_3A007356 [Cinara cedri]|uniref:Uncharacterized protein n=1 Tax=Cinara cedri TaxID=506608 RepID=A0A5E4M8B6_9HEMI|nr:Hypothetical protein CINCED_3A007356 [Cinara cedri]